MKLVDAPGSPEMVAAINHHIVRVIVDIMLSQIKNRTFFQTVALFLKNHEGSTTPSFAIKLAELRRYGQFRPNGQGDFVSPSYVGEFAAKLEELYAQSPNTVGYQRGAIVELLAFELVKSRWQSDECLGNQIFVYERNRFSTDQIDVAVLSQRKHQIEAYTCKIKPIAIGSSDCNNLIDLAREASEQDYDIHTGAISFANSWEIERRLNYFPRTEEIKAYGINNMRDLEIDPFN